MDFDNKNHEASKLLESYLKIFGGESQESFDDASDRKLQFSMPDYTSPPLPEALALTPDYYQSDDVMDEARDLAATGNCTIQGNRCQIPFPAVEGFEGSRVGVVFYNGGLVDPRGYAPIASILNKNYGIPVVMPIFAADFAFVIGICDSNRLDFAKAEFPDVEKWVLAGHSFGGVSASVDMWSRWNIDESAGGLALFAADNQGGLGCGDTNFADTDLPMAQVLAAEDGVLNMTRVASNAFRNPESSTFFVEIAGANHASFGAYDYSERFELFGQVDGNSSIPNEIVWEIAADAIVNVAERMGVPLPSPVPIVETVETSGADALSSSTFLTMIACLGWLVCGRF